MELLYAVCSTKERAPQTLHLRGSQKDHPKPHFGSSVERSKKARLQIRRPHNLLRIHASHGHGERPRRRLRVPRQYGR